MATKEDIERLLKGRQIIDDYLKARTDLEEREDTTKLIEQLNKDIMGLEFRDLEEFYLFDAKLSFLEISDSIDIINRFTGEKEPHCDNCIGREPQWCMETMVAKGVDTACHQRKITADIATSSDYLNLGLVTKVLTSDPILDKQKAAAVIREKTTGNLCTINDIILFWYYHGLETNRCIGLVKQYRDFDFDPFWRLGKMCLPMTKE